MSLLEQKMAQFSFDAELSNEEYESFVDIVNTAIKMERESKDPIEIKMTTMDKVKRTLKKDADPCLLVGHEEEFTAGVGGPLVLLFRDIHDLCAHQFNYPSFSDVMNLYPSIYCRDDEDEGPRVYDDIDSGTWWQSLQEEVSERILPRAPRFLTSRTTFYRPL
ncbi:hypothetical protein BJV82DRAFT_676122 [Fennellomyces sp. T-0311]|nr:hypothetical protein BJV82DRAFT_676122 [Fennellomyces sp. T-0311]